MKLSNEKDTEILNINLFNFNPSNIIEKIDNDICQSEFNESLTIESESNNSLDIHSSQNMNGPKILTNGLISDYNHYMKSLFFVNAEGVQKIHEYTIGSYTRKSIISLKKTAQLFSPEYHTLQPKQDLDGDVIDVSAIIFEKNWVGAIFIPTTITCTFFDETKWDPHNNWPMFHIIFQSTTRYIFMPYVSMRHWRIFLIDMYCKCVTLIDPLEKKQSELEAEGKKVYTCFLRYLEYCKNRGIENSFRPSCTSWDMVWFLAPTEMPRQKDGYNCGIFVIYYMHIIGQNKKFDKNFDPDAYRNYLAETLINESENMQDVCQFCFNSKKKAGVKTCRECRRFTHVSCLRSKTLSQSPKCELCMES